MCRTLLDFISQSLYDNGMSLEDRREMKQETRDLISRIDNEMSITIEETEHIEEEI